METNTVQMTHEELEQFRAYQTEKARKEAEGKEVETKDELPQQVLDFTWRMYEEVAEYSFKVAKYALLKLFPDEKIQREEIWAGYEDIAHYVIPVYTIRYKGKILCRRYQEDIEGLRYRFESPIFETENNKIMETNTVQMTQEELEQFRAYQAEKARKEAEGREVEMKDELPQQVLNLYETVETIVVEHGFMIAEFALQKLFPGKKIPREKLQISNKMVKPYSFHVYAITYKGHLLCKRYQFGLMYRFESPIFETEKQ